MKTTEIIAEELRAIATQLTEGCHMNHCIIKPPTGMAPNGGCRCTKDQISRRLSHLSADVMTIRGEWKGTGYEQPKKKPKK